MSNGLLRLVVSFASRDRLSGSLKGIVGLAQSGSQRLAGMKREARDLERELKGVQTEMASASGNITGLMTRERELRERIERTNREMQEQVRLLRIQANVEKMKARGEALKSAGQTNVMQGAAILAPLIVAGKGAAEFQSGMTDIALKAALSRRETAGLQREILGAARAALQLPENMRAGVDVLAGFGMTPQEATRMVAPIGKVATAYKAEIADLASASFANFSNLKVPVTETARALEIMAAAGNAGAFEIKDMAQYFPSLTAQAQAYGQKGVAAVADLAAAAQIARKGTGDSASAATNLQNLLAKINTKETIGKFKKFGVDLPAALKKAYAAGKTPLEAIAEITNKTLGGDLSRMSFLFGDMQAQSALRPLIQNMDEYRRIRDEAMASKGAVDAAFARRAEDASTKTQALIGNLQRMAITLGPVLLPPFVRMTEAAARLVDRFVNWAQANPRLANTLIMLVAGLGALKIGLGAAQFAFGMLLGPAASVFGFFARNGPALLSVLSGIRMGFLFLARGVMQAGAMMLANPIVAAVVAIVAALAFAGYMIWKHWDTIKAAFWAGVGFLKGLAGQFMDAGRALLDGLINGLTSRLAAVRDKVKAVGSSVVGWFKDKLGIHSPSRVFMALGGYIAGGLALGIAQGEGSAAQAATRMADRVASAGADGAMSPAIAPRLTPMLPAHGGRSALGSAAPITINIYAQPGQSAQDIAAEVERILREREGRGSASRRSEFRDDEE